MTFKKAIESIKTSELIEGIVQLGSGVIGYKDEFSDIDLMISTSNEENVEKTKEFVHECFSSFHSVYIKDLQLRENIYLVIAFMENGLEFNASILPTEQLSVKSPLWKVVVDKSGKVHEKMKHEHERFTTNLNKYNDSNDLSFEFFYSMRKLHTELKRNNVIYALKMLEEMRGITLLVQAMNENKKLHQFKAYETLSPEFIQEFLSTYPGEMNIEELFAASDRLRELFLNVIEESARVSLDETLFRII
ncbi:aminoglycoside 6-adenylyltransferase [Bacillus sp. BHET2]|uniref:aminoglycoside 6-adenylyltransferase n=1 Tax=Bacillus sp. BHET2 TaxID=2583818 RepID=UPI001485D7AF|nr:aminoglycoside 6-adenylyltransferase [Bacillus sp. BHET2]